MSPETIGEAQKADLRKSVAHLEADVKTTDHEKLIRLSYNTAKKAANQFLDQCLESFGTIWEAQRTFSPDDYDELEAAIDDFAFGWGQLKTKLTNDASLRPEEFDFSKRLFDFAKKVRWRIWRPRIRRLFRKQESAAMAGAAFALGVLLHLIIEYLKKKSGT